MAGLSLSNDSDIIGLFSQIKGFLSKCFAILKKMRYNGKRGCFCGLSVRAGDTRKEGKAQSRALEKVW